MGIFNRNNKAILLLTTVFIVILSVFAAKRGIFVKKYTPQDLASGQLSDGVVRGYYENGHLRFEEPRKNGSAHGISKGYYENGGFRFINCFEFHGHARG